MKLHKKVKIEAACSDDKDRRSILSPYLERDGDGGKLIATNGRIIAVVPVECDDGDTAGYLPASCIKDARKRGLVELGEKATIPGVSIYERNPGNETFPNWKAVIPDNKGVKIVRLCLDPAFLKDLADAMGTAGVALEIPIGNYGDGTSRAGSDNCVKEPVVVRPADARGCHSASPEAIGVIMPIRIT